MIPFRYGSVVSGDDFCGRREIIAQLTAYILAGQNVLVQGERRIGKTSLIYETTRRLRPCSPIFVDLMEIKSARDLYQRMIRAGLLADKKGSLFTRALKTFAALRPRLGADPVTGLPTVTLDASLELGPESLEEVVDWLGSRKGRHPVVVLDEFQDVLNLPDAASILAVLRSKIQYHDRIAYIFAGSVRHKLDGIFTRSDSPLFKAALPLTLEPIAREEFAMFIRKKFAAGRRRIPDPVVARIFNATDGVSGDVQQMCEALWTVSGIGEDLTEDHFHSAFELIFSRESASYELILTGLTALQSQCLSALARVGGKAVTSGRFLQESGVKQPSSVSRAISKLLKMKIIFVKNREYCFVNPFFRAWLVSRGI